MVPILRLLFPVVIAGCMATTLHAGSDLISSVTSGATEKVENTRKLLAAGANVNEVDKHGWTALMYATQVKRKAKELVSVLLEKGADPNIQATGETKSMSKGVTALHIASCAHDAEVVDLLLEAGAKVDLVDATGDTPLHLASWSGASLIVGKLLAAGAKVDTIDATGKRAIDYAKDLRFPSVSALLCQASNPSATESCFPGEVNESPLGKTYSRIVLVDFLKSKSNQIIGDEAKTVAQECQDATLSVLKGMKRFESVDMKPGNGTEDASTLLVAARVDSFGINSTVLTNPRNLATIVITLRLLDASTGHMVREQTLRYECPKVITIREYHAPDKFIPEDMGAMIAAYIMNINRH